jgi:hypothetical protein
MEDTKVYLLQGRKFRSVTAPTVEQDMEVYALSHEAGLLSMTKGAGENEAEFAQRILRVMYRSSKLFYMLGTLLMPQEKRDADWTPALAGETAEFLRQVTDPESKQIIRAMALDLLEIFTKAGAELLRNLESVSTNAALSVERQSTELRPA